MSALKSWTGGALLLLALAGGLRAEVTVSQSNDPTEVAAEGLASVLMQERTGLGAVPAARITAITTPPRAKAGSSTLPEEITADWLASQPTPNGDEQFQCLTDAIYHEARGESVEGQVAVAEVVLNRVDDPRFPHSVCGVVRERGGGSCQFSWTCDGRSDRVSDGSAYDLAGRIARAMLDGAPRDLTDGATYFHTTGVRPGWSRRFERTAMIGAHLFYRSPVMTASN